MLAARDNSSTKPGLHDLKARSLKERYRAEVAQSVYAANSNSRSNSADQKLKLFLQIESGVRAASNPDELMLTIANETPKLVGARQCFVFFGDAKQKLAAISSLAEINRAAPLASEIEQTIRFLSADNGLNSIRQFDIPAGHDSNGSALSCYPFRNLIWVPFNNAEGALLGGMLLADNRKWTDSDTVILKQIASVYSYSMDFFKAKARKWPALTIRKSIEKKHLFAATALLLLSMAFPVSMKTLAPFEVAAKDPFIVSSYIDGVIDDILVEPGQAIAKGQPVIRFSNTIHNNALEIANRELAVSQARLKRANQLAFDSEEGRKELSLAMADIALKQARLDLAEDQSKHTVIYAAKSGVAIFPEKQKLIGKPVEIGEQIMTIANDNETEIKIDLPVSDSIFLIEGTRVVLFLDSDPVNSREAIVQYINYQPGFTSNRNLAYQITAKIEETAGNRVGIGVQGTAQIYGKTVPLLLYLFRRPLTFVRQWIGW
ncbi:MAG: HlyD family efflux transporter periplasmic adaptor subunit [Pseudomonadota bacterium]